MIHRNTEMNTRAIEMTAGGSRDGISPATAATIIREFEPCPNCDESIDPSASDGLYEDRDVIWENDARYNSTAHTCQHCKTELRIFVEEKAFGVISEARLPDDAEARKDIHFVPVEGSGSYLVINPFQMYVSEATPRPSSCEYEESVPVHNN